MSTLELRSTAAELRRQTVDVTNALRDALSAVVLAIEGVGARPTALAKRLGLDKNLTSRILAALRTQDALGAAHRIPAPQGLRIFLHAASRIPAARELCETAEECVTQFENLIESQAGGRGALDTAISGWLPDARERGERSRKQAVFKAMSYLLGYECDVMTTTHIVQPSADGARCDRVDILGKFGVRRMRDGPPITLTSNLLVPFDFEGPRRPQVLTLSGEPMRKDDACTIDEFCTPRLPPLELHHSASVLRYALGASVPPINVPVSYVFGNLVRDAQLRYRTESQSEEWIETVPRIPAKRLIMDLFVRDDVWPTAAPSVTPRLYGLITDSKGRDDDFVRLDQVDVQAHVQSLGLGTGAIGTSEVADYTALMRHVFERIGWNSRRFRVYRCQTAYPIPFISLTMWFDLPAPDGPVD